MPQSTNAIAERSGSTPGTRKPSTPPNVARVQGFFTDLVNRIGQEAQPQQQSGTGGTGGTGGLSFGQPSGLQRQWPVAGQPGQNDAWGSPQTITPGYENNFANKPKDAQGRPLGTGNDVTAREGTPVKPVVGGTVVEVKRYDPAQAAAGRDATGGYGNSVVIRGDDGLLYRYSHLQDARVQPGQRIGQDGQVGLVGTTGNTTGAHLDLEVTDAQGNFIDAVGLIRGDPEVRRLAPAGRPDPGPLRAGQAGRAGAPSGAAGGPQWLAAATSQVGKPYVWGSAGGRSDFSGNAPGYDCSGFAAYVMKTGLGVTIPAFTGTAYPATQAVGQEEARAGDLVFWNMNQGDPKLQHVAVYLGNGQVIQSGGAGSGVNIAPVTQMRGAEFRRVPAAQQALAAQGTPPDVSAQAQQMTAGAGGPGGPGGGRQPTPGATPVSNSGMRNDPGFLEGLRGQEERDRGGTPAPAGPTGATVPGGWNRQTITAALAANGNAERLRELGARYKIDPGVLAGLLLYESGGRPNQTSSQGAQGPMQVMPNTAAGLGLDPNRLQDMDYGTEAGVIYFASLLQRFNGDYDNAIAAYINGQGLSNTTARDANGTTGPAYLKTVRGIEAEIKNTPEIAQAIGAQVQPAPGSLTGAGMPPPGAGPATPTTAALNRIIAERKQAETAAQGAVSEAQTALNTARTAHEQGPATNPRYNAEAGAAAVKEAQARYDAAVTASRAATADRQKAEADLAQAQTTGATQAAKDSITWQDGKPYRIVTGPDGKATVEPITIPGMEGVGKIDPNRYQQLDHPNGLGKGLYDLQTNQWVYTPSESASDALKRRGEEFDLTTKIKNQPLLDQGLQVELDQARQTLQEYERKNRVGQATEQDEIAAIQADARIKQLTAGHWEEDFASDEAAQKAGTAKVNLEAAALQRKQDNWKKIQDAWANGASMEELNGLVLQSAEDVNQYVALLGEDRLRQAEAEKQRNALVTEELTRQQRRREDVQQYGTAMESYGRYGVATAPWQTSVLSAAAPLQGVEAAARGLGIQDTSQPWIKGISDQYGAYQNRQQNTAGAARDAYNQTQTSMLGDRFSPNANRRASAVNQQAQEPAAGGNYGTTNPPPSSAGRPATQATEPIRSAPGETMGAPNPASQAGQETPATAPARQPVQGQDALDLGDPEVAASVGEPVQPGVALTIYDNGEKEKWNIGEGGGYLPMPPGAYGGGGYGQGGGGEGGSGGRGRLARKRRPVPGKQVVDFGDGEHVVTHYDDGSKEIWPLKGGSPSWEGVGGGGSGFWGQRPATYGIGHRGGGGSSVWQLPPASAISLAAGAPLGASPTPQQAQSFAARQGGQSPPPNGLMNPPAVPPSPQSTPQRFPTPMAGGFGGPRPTSGQGGGGTGGGVPPGLEQALGAAGQPQQQQPPPGIELPLGYQGGGMYQGGGGSGIDGQVDAPWQATQAQASQMPQAAAPMWDAATPAANLTTGVGGPSGAAGQSTLYRPGASPGGPMAGSLAGGGGRGAARRQGGYQPASGGYYGGAGMPQAMTPLQRLMQQAGIVPLSAGAAAGTPGGI